MKARVKATGALLIVRPYDGSDFDWICDMDGETGSLWKTEELEFIDDYEPDYWAKLKHQATIAAMQGLMSKEILDTPNSLLSHAIHYATALVNKLKEEEKCKE